jgi:outer membrane scaffolding protein for murein synthesis (MipA/OmpV family)
VLPALTRNLIPRMVGTDSEPNWPDAALVPLLWLAAMNYELFARARANLALAATAARRRPRPTDALIQGRHDLDRRATQELTGRAGDATTQQVKNRTDTET